MTPRICVLLAAGWLGAPAFAQDTGDPSVPDSDSGVTPIYYEGNPNCADLGYAHGFKPQADGGGDFDGGIDDFDFPGDSQGNFVHVESDGTFVDWVSTLGIDAVIVKGGPNANSYVYEPPEESFGDTGLAPPLNNTEPYGLSHLEFCYDYELGVEKTAVPYFVRTWVWDIEKVGDETEVTVAEGQPFLVSYDVSVTSFFADTDFKVSGTITVTNPDPDFDANVVSVSDVVSVDIPADVDCGVVLPFVLGPGQSLECTYSAFLPDGTDRVNEATAETADGDLVGGGAGTADVIFGDPSTVVDGCVDVTDSQAGDLGTVCEGTLFEFEYELDVTAGAECGDSVFENVASFVTENSLTEGSSSWTVDVTVTCDDSCTLTQGYWKTHSEKGPAPYDDTWAMLANGADTAFFLSGKSYYKVLWTPPAGNAYYNLAHQYIAAKLNTLNGSSTTPAIAAAIAAAEALFNAQGVNDTTLTATERRTAITLAGQLDKYNNGLVGPGHCDEDPYSY